MKPEQLEELVAAWPGEWDVPYPNYAVREVGDYHVSVEFLYSGPSASVTGPTFQIAEHAKTCAAMRDKVVAKVAEIEAEVAMLRKLVGP